MSEKVPVEDEKLYFIKLHHYKDQGWTYLKYPKIKIKNEKKQPQKKLVGNVTLIWSNKKASQRFLVWTVQGGQKSGSDRNPGPMILPALACNPLRQVQVALNVGRGWALM